MILQDQSRPLSRDLVSIHLRDHLQAITVKHLQQRQDRRENCNQLMSRGSPSWNQQPSF